MASQKNGDYYLHYYTTYSLKQELYKKEWFSSVVELPFEGLKIKAPIGYKEYLTQMYGDYMKLPPKEKQVSHHALVFLSLKGHFSIKEIKQKLKSKR